VSREEENAGVPSRDFQGDHDQFVEDKRGERDGDDIQEFGLEEHEGHEHDGRAYVRNNERKKSMRTGRFLDAGRQTLVYADHQPLEERLVRERSTLPKKRVTKREDSCRRGTPRGQELGAYLCEFLVQLGVYQCQVFVHVRVQHQRKHGCHRIDRRIANHEPSLV
jgi:hypothetical protein